MRRAVKSKRDYLGRGSHFSWLYLSRLAALKEFAFMKALGQHGLPVPEVCVGVVGTACGGRLEGDGMPWRGTSLPDPVACITPAMPTSLPLPAHPACCRPSTATGTQC